MSHALLLSDDQYRVTVSLAASRGQTPEDLIASLLDEAWERECARFDAAFEANAGWLASADEAAACGDESPVAPAYPSTGAFCAHLAQTRPRSRRRGASMRPRAPSSAHV